MNLPAASCRDLDPKRDYICNRVVVGDIHSTYNVGIREYFRRQFMCRRIGQGENEIQLHNYDSQVKRSHEV